MTAGNRFKAARPPRRSWIRPTLAPRQAPVTGSDHRPALALSHRTAAAGVLFAASLAVFLAVFGVLPKRPWSMLDLRVYLWGGRNVRLGHDPYLHTFLPHSLHFTYTPMAAGIFALLTFLSVPAVKLLSVAAGIASLVVTLWLTTGALGRERSAARLGAVLAAAAGALWLEPVRLTLSLGQVNLVLMVIVVADLCLPDSRWWKGAGVGLAAGFKLTPLIFIPYLLLTRRFRAAAVASGTFAVTVLVPFAAMPRASRLYWLDGLFLNPKRLGNVHYVGNQSLYGALLRLLGSASAARPYQLAADVLIGLGGLALAAWASRRGQEMAGVLVCALTGLLVSPVSWSHHWVWIAPMLVALADFAVRPPSLAAAVRWRRRCWLCAAAAAVVFSGVIWAVPSPAVQGYDMTGPQQLIGDLYVLAGLAGLGVIAALMVAARRRDQRLVMPAVARDGGEPFEPGLAARP